MSRVRADRFTNREGTGSPTFVDGVNVIGISSLGITTVTGVGQTALTVNGKNHWSSDSWSGFSHYQW
jgi:hypothetical protein